MKSTLVTRWTLCGIAVSVCLVLSSCSDTLRPESREIALVSGDNQTGEAGRQLDERFAVLVTDGRGVGVAGVAVTWTVTSGEGAFEDDVEAWDENDCAQIPTETTRLTGSDGFADVRFTPTGFGPVTVNARAAGVSEQVTFRTDASDPRALLTIVAGNHYEGKAGETSAYDPGLPLWGSQRFEVRVLDGEGGPVPRVAVRWATTSGDVALYGCSPAGLQPVPSTWTRTRSDGIAAADYRLVVPGPSTVAAAVPGVLVSPVTFTVTATGVVVILGHLAAPDPSFLGPDGSSDLTVPVGTPVEWMNGLGTARIVSTAVPPGGTPFDSGDLGQGEWFEFVPDVFGTWEYIDEVSGATGTLTAG
jgi:hypothetical protein